VAAPRAGVAGIAVGAIPFQRCQADGSSRGVSAGGEFLNCFGGQRLATDAPLATGYFGDLHPGHPPHVLAFDRDHGIGQFLCGQPRLSGSYDLISICPLDTLEMSLAHV
jgi:hypothetical protein